MKPESLTEETVLDICEGALAYLCFKNGGTLVLPRMPDELLDRPFTITCKFPKDGGVVFKLKLEDVH